MIIKSDGLVSICVEKSSDSSHVSSNERPFVHGDPFPQMLSEGVSSGMLSFQSGLSQPIQSSFL